jgi:hypothetical protein
MSRSAEPCDCIFRRNIAVRWRANFGIKEGR